MDSLLLDEQQLATLRSVIEQNDTFVITGHKGPDGDAVGSCLAWMLYLRSLGKKASVVMPDADPDFLHWMPAHDKIVRYDKQKEEAEKLYSEAQVVCCLDFNESSRVEDMQGMLDDFHGVRLMVDHHVNPVMDAVVRVSHPEACSTCELIFRLISQLGDYDKISHDIAECLYCGMMTDTGGFTYNSNRPDVFYIISQLLDKGVDKDQVYNHVFHNYSQWALRLRAHVILDKLKVMEELHASYYSVTRQDMKKYHFIKGDLEGLVNEPLTMRGHKLSISLREDRDRDNYVLVSLRSSCGFHCRQMASEFFNGGGHEDAAGGHLECSMEEAEQTTIRAILAYRDCLTNN